MHTPSNTATSEHSVTKLTLAWYKKKLGNVLWSEQIEFKSQDQIQGAKVPLCSGPALGGWRPAPSMDIGAPNIQYITFNT